MGDGARAVLSKLLLDTLKILTIGSPPSLLRQDCGEVEWAVEALGEVPYNVLFGFHTHDSRDSGKAL